MTDVEFREPTGEDVPPVESDVPSASPDPDGPDENAPYGYMTDRRTGERRPRQRPPYRSLVAAKAPLASGPSPSLDQLKAEKRAATEDVPPSSERPKRGSKRGRADKPEPEYPAFRAGPIAKGVNRLYFRAGKIIKVWDKAVGEAIISTTQKFDDEDITVGEAWEEIARTNPKIRKILLRLISGGAWGDLFMAHMPILLAIMLKDAVRSRLPFGKLIEAFIDDEESESENGPMGGLASMLGDLDPQTAAQMTGIAQGLMAQMTAGMSRGPGGPPRSPGIAFGMEGDG